MYKNLYHEQTKLIIKKLTSIIYKNVFHKQILDRSKQPVNINILNVLATYTRVIDIKTD